MVAELKKPAQPVPDWLADVAPVYAQMGAEELKAEFAKYVAGTLNNIRHMACIVRRFEELGVDLSDIRTPWLDDLRRVAYGQLLPELVVMGTRNRTLLNEARLLPIPDQEKIARDEPIPILVKTDNGYEPRNVPPSKLDNWQVRQGFARGRIRSEVEQRNLLDNPRRQHKEYGPNIVVEKKLKRIRVSGECVYLTISDLTDYLRKLTE